MTNLTCECFIHTSKDLPLVIFHNYIFIKFEFMGKFVI